MKYFPLYASFFLLNAQSISAVMKQNALRILTTQKHSRWGNRGKNKQKKWLKVSQEAKQSQESFLRISSTETGPSQSLLTRKEMNEKLSH